jgi:hypothetical protein
MNKKLLVVLMGALTALSLAAQEVPKAEVYLGYSLLRVNSATAVPAFTANGGVGALQFNVNKYLGFVSEFGGYHNGNISDVQLDSTAMTYLFGPRFTMNKEGKIAPFGEVMFGGMYYTRSIAVPAGAVVAGADNGRIANSSNAFAMAVGGGLDIKIGRHFAFRPIQLDYLLTRFPTLFIPGIGSISDNKNQNNLRYSAGGVFLIGGAPQLPPTSSCSGSPAELLPDEGPVNVSVQTSNFNPKHKLDYDWTSTGGTVTKDGTSSKIEVAGLAPGRYTITSTVTDPKQKKMNIATCTQAFTVKQPRPPVVSCLATPASAMPGVPVTISAQGSSPDNRPIRDRKYTASAGTLKEGETATGAEDARWTTTSTLDTNGVQPGPVSVNLVVTDSRGLTGSCEASFNLEPAPPEVVVEKATLFKECEFKNDKKRARVDNECKAILDDVALRLQQEPNGKVVIVGYAEEEEEVSWDQTAPQRALNSKQYLTAGEAKQQIDPSRIEVRSGRNRSKKAEIYYVPAGAVFEAEETTVIDETQLTPMNAPPAKHRKAAQAAAAVGE